MLISLSGGSQWESYHAYHIIRVSLVVSRDKLTNYQYAMSSPVATNSCGGGQCWTSLGMQMATWGMRDLDNQFRETDCKVGGNI